MSSAEAASHPAGRPSVFLSYASEDRPAVRKLRDALEAAGVDAWYDENELTGGDAWDAKIRRQIRECTYFMPVISSRASARLEGYFRREWRLAIERTLDMADDIVFLLPVVIDDSTEATARVPEKFLTVQWLRVPEGEATRAFNELAARLAAGGPERLHHAPQSRNSRPKSEPRPPAYLPPIDDDPPPPKEWWRWPKFFWKKIPRWVRFFIWCAVIIWALDSCSDCRGPKKYTQPSGERSSTKRAKTDTAKKDAAADPTSKATETAQAAANRPDVAAVMSQVGTALQQVGVLANNAARKEIDVLVPTISNSSAANRVQSDMFGKFIMADGVRTQIHPQRLAADETPVDRAKKMGARFVVQTTEEKNSDGEALLRVTLWRVEDGAQLWSGDFPAGERAGLITAQAYAQMLPHVLKKD